MPANFILRVSVLGLIADAEDVLLIDQTDPPEPDRWDLPGGGLEPHESILEGLAREIYEETSVTDFQVEGLLTIVETYMERRTGGTQHQLNIIYKCSVPHRPANLHSAEPEVGVRGIQWVAIASLTPASCTTRTWKALQAAGLASSST
ncbi:NUDIX domain-containing protein [Phormidium tenue FACHB-886]|nr:NUDIX domain-containing protein [Phormidium tenue FACHB-886]